MHKNNLHSIAKIDSGKSFRSKPEFVYGYGVGLVQMKDVSPSGVSSNLMKIDHNEANPEQLLQDGDILFVAKGNNNYAVTFRSSDPAPAIAASFFFVIRPDKNQVHPEYLTWYINSSPAQQYFDQHRMGATVGNIRKRVLEELEIPLPDLQQQSRIETIYGLWELEKKNTLSLLKAKETLYKNLLKELSMSRTVERQTDNEYMNWCDIWVHSKMYPAEIELIENIVSDEGLTTNKIYCTFFHIETTTRTYKKDDGSVLHKPELSGWQYIELKNVRHWNNPKIPQKEKAEKYLKRIDHEMVKRITLYDNATKNIMFQKENVL
ncbi:hypothetical protein GYB22_03390 [bacterium]|nr:hypothetical protein [bacterium]